MKRAVVGAILLGAASIAVTPPAHADGFDDMVHDAALICRRLDQDSSPQGVVAIITDQMLQGIDKTAIAAVMNYAVMYLCPEYTDEIEYTAQLVGN